MSHTGFVLELDPEHPYFNARRTDQDEFGHLRQVRYRDVRPSASLIDLDGTEMFLVKSKEWSYEREWRILRPLKDAQNVVNASPLKNPQTTSIARLHLRFRCAGIASFRYSTSAEAWRQSVPFSATA
ncbi:DUF2971 domain-containing protein [Xanthomonas oryzae]|uniref:DUF2971 domain-containing protein n=1 Tax=Xanthomonas oryzae TaxID=347 RepID=UPI0019823CD9